MTYEWILSIIQYIQKYSEQTSLPKNLYFISARLWPPKSTFNKKCSQQRLVNKTVHYVLYYAQQHSVVQGCVRGQHGRGQGQGSSRPRPRNFVLEVSSRSRPVLEDPHPRAWLFYRAMLRRERLCHVVCLSTTLKFNALLPPLVRLCIYEVLYLWYWVLYLLTILKNWTSYSQISKPKPRPRIVEAKSTKFCPRARGQSSRTPSLRGLSVPPKVVRCLIPHCTYISVLKVIKYSQQQCCW